MHRAVVGRRLLVVDADRITRTVLQHAYGMRGHTVRVVATAAESLVAVMTEPPEAVVYDWSFRDDSGVGLAKKLRATAPGPLAIVSLSVMNEPDGFVEREGIDGYIVKPALPEVVERAIEDALAKLTPRRRL